MARNNPANQTITKAWEEAVRKEARERFARLSDGKFIDDMAIMTHDLDEANSTSGLWRPARTPSGIMIDVERAQRIMLPMALYGNVIRPDVEAVLVDDKRLPHVRYLAVTLENMLNAIARESRNKLTK